MQLFGTTGQRFLCCPGTKGQQDKLKILPRAGTGRDSLSKSCHGTGQAGTASHNPGPDRGRDNHYFSVKIWGRTFSALKPPFPVFCLFWKVILSRDRGTSHGTGRAGTASQNLATGRDGPGQLVKIRDGTGDGTRKYFLSQDKGTTGHPVPDCPAGRPVPWKP